MENGRPVVFNGTKPGTRPEGVGTEPSEAKVKKSRGMRVTEPFGFAQDREPVERQMDVPAASAVGRG